MKCPKCSGTLWMYGGVAAAHCEKCHSDWDLSDPKPVAPELAALEARQPKKRYYMVGGGMYDRTTATAMSLTEILELLNAHAAELRDAVVSADEAMFAIVRSVLNDPAIPHANKANLIAHRMRVHVRTVDGHNLPVSFQLAPIVEAARAVAGKE